MSSDQVTVYGELRHWRRRAAGDRDVAALLRLKPNAWRGLSLVAIQWLIIFGAAIGAENSGAIWGALAAVIVIATRQHALLVLMHDASHHLLMRNRRTNDLVSDLCLAFPLWISTGCYRDHHFAHHRFLNTTRDPDYADAFPPASRAELLVLMIQDLCGLSTLKSLRSINKFGVTALWKTPTRTRERKLFVAFAVTVIVAIVATHCGQAFLLYWIVPLVFVLPLILRMRSLGEHAGLLPNCRNRPARTIVTGPVDRLLFAPCNIGRHLEHHLFPMVPSYRLERLSQLLRGIDLAPFLFETRGYLFGSKSMLAELFAKVEHCQ